MKTLECRLCGADVHKVDDAAFEVTCSDCIMESLRVYDTPTKKKQASSQGYPKGWRFMKEFVHADGTVYLRGVEQPSLKGTRSSTTIVVRPKKTKQQKKQEKQEVLSKYSSLKKDLKKETRKTVIKKIESKLKKLQKQI
jgi:hypothetical protein